MAKQWKCARCGTKNVETTLTCSNCRMIRGAVVVKSSQDAGWSWQPANPPTAQPPDPVTTPLAQLTNPTTAQPSPAPTPTYWAPPIEATHGRSRMRLLIPTFFLVVGVVGAALAVFSASPRAPMADAVDTGFGSFAMEVGDCLDIADVSGEEVSGITARPCNREHEYEVVFTGSADGVGYPTDDAMSEYFNNLCVPAFEAYVGEAWGASPLDIFWLTPTREGWRQGDRSIHCMVYHPTVKRLTTSLKGAGRLRA